MILFASDLDNTMIHSYKKMGPPAICVEKMEQKELSYMTKKAYHMLQEIEKQICFVPVTTRSVAQYKRIFLFENKYPQYALVCNGGILLYKNEIEPHWLSETNEMIADAMKELEKAVSLLKKDRRIIFEVRLVDGIFVYTKASPIKDVIHMLEQYLDLNKVFVDCNGEKLYVFPCVLDKGKALKRLQKQLQCKSVISAGDSGFDLPMLNIAHTCIIPNDSFMIDNLKNHANVIVSKKEFGGFTEEILETVQCIIEKSAG